MGGQGYTPSACVENVLPTVKWFVYFIHGQKTEQKKDKLHLMRVGLHLCFWTDSFFSKGNLQRLYYDRTVNVPKKKHVSIFSASPFMSTTARIEYKP